jgi:formimidoylglutamate deiminase
MRSMQQGQAAAPTVVTFANLWLDGQWRRDATLTIDTTGSASELAHGDGTAPGASTVVPGITLPGLVNAHCHAFQRPLGAWTQRQGSPGDNFWSWREGMYELAGDLDLEDLAAITARCYLDLLRGGYTHVAEFLYLHRLGVPRDGAPNADAAVATAAALAGMGVTLLPTLYQHADFGGVPPTPGQQPFVRSTAQYLADWRELLRRYPADGPVALGAAFHSLRAVDVATIGALAPQLLDEPRCRGLHMHVAEQPAEVAACVAQHGLAPMALLAARGLLSPRWSLVHATHSSAAELELARCAGATVVLCPSTEADLGDGCPDIAGYLDAAGAIAIGSDSNIGRSATTELRLLEWSQRLARQRRNVLAAPGAPRVADRLYRAAWQGGQRALGVASGGGQRRADFVTYDGDAGDWALQAPEDFLSALVFDAANPQARHVMVGGRWVIRDGVHAHEAAIETSYRAALQRLAARRAAAGAGQRRGASS